MLSSISLAVNVNNGQLIHCMPHSCYFGGCSYLSLLDYSKNILPHFKRPNSLNDNDPHFWTKAWQTWHLSSVISKWWWWWWWWQRRLRPEYIDEMVYLQLINWDEPSMQSIVVKWRYFSLHPILPSIYGWWWWWCTHVPSLYFHVTFQAICLDDMFLMLPMLSSKGKCRSVLKPLFSHMRVVKSWTSPMGELYIYMFECLSSYSLLHFS